MSEDESPKFDYDISVQEVSEDSKPESNEPVKPVETPVISESKSEDKPAISEIKSEDNLNQHRPRLRKSARLNQKIQNL